MPSCTTLARVVLLALVLGSGVALSKQEPAVPPAVSDVESGLAVNASDGIAIHGYDPVAYLIDHEAVPGSAEFAAIWRGAEWRFSSARNRALFVADPARYAPQYGGFGAYGTAIGKAYDVDPRVFDVIDGRLYLHRNDRVRELWQRNPKGYIAEADDTWRQRMRSAGS